MLSALPPADDDRVLVDFRTADDAGVYAWREGLALVQTVDFFTPIVDDPFVYGQIAAANALSDVYAMGGRPLTALAIAGFPVKDAPDAGTVQAIFRGGHEKLREADVALLGGHTVQDLEIKFGYAVTGEVDPARVFRNAGAQAGDRLVLTKAIGTGVIATALKFDRANHTAVRAAIDSMTALNRPAAEVLRDLEPGIVHACTDITGFGLVGHASEMAAASGCTLEIEAAAVPVLPGALELALDNTPGGGVSNREAFPAQLASEGLDPARVALLYDPQTSGGLLVAIAPGAVRHVLESLVRAGVAAALVGRCAPLSNARVTIV